MSDDKSLAQKDSFARKSKVSKMDAYNQGWEQVRKYMASRDIPEWFRGISNFQTAAANNLLEALLFDLEQHTYYRVRRCLSALGLQPMISGRDIRILMKLSQGNDLAFLWFLLEKHYKSTTPGYTVNEQLIMSVMAHLDMVTTLRELDRILPKNPPKEKVVLPKKLSRIIVKPSKFMGKVPKTSSPYLQPIKTPPPAKKQSPLRRPDLKISLAEYEIWADPKYVVRNEANRWFAHYTLKPAKRVVHNILKEEIDRIFNDYESVAENSRHDNIVCEYHRRLEETKESLRNGLDNERRERLRQHFDVDTIKMNRTRDRILTELETNVKMFKAKFRNSAERRNPNLIEVFTADDTVEFHEQSRIELECEGNEYEDDNDVYENHPSCSGSGSGNGNENENEKENRKENNELRNKQEHVDVGSLGSTSSSNENVCKAACDKKFKSLVFNEIINCQETNKGHKIDERSSVKGKCDQFDTVSESPSKQFFIASKTNTPWFFEFHKIFDVNHPYTPETLNVKQKCAEALDSETSFATKYRPIDIDAAIKQGIKRDWTKAVKQYSSDKGLQQKNERLGDRRDDKGDEQLPLKFDRDYFDPNDKAYMKHMLERAFNFMRRDPKFVLAALPDAHKLPSFFYFIQNRFGKRYSYQERQQLYQETLRILRALEKLTKSVPMPKIKGFGTRPFIKYSCRDYLIQKGTKIRQEYYNDLDNIIMEQARVFWFAVRPYLCSSGPPRNTFFAYMPPRTVDITRFRQWKSSEYMDAKKEWDRRQREKMPP